MRTVLVVILAASAFGILGIPASTSASAACFCSQRAGCAFKGCVAGKCSYLCFQVKATKPPPK